MGLKEGHIATLPRLVNQQPFLQTQALPRQGGDPRTGSDIKLVAAFNKTSRAGRVHQQVFENAALRIDLLAELEGTTPIKVVGAMYNLQTDAVQFLNRSVNLKGTRRVKS